MWSKYVNVYLQVRVMGVSRKFFESCEGCKVELGVWHICLSKLQLFLSLNTKDFLISMWMNSQSSTCFHNKSPATLDQSVSSCHFLMLVVTCTFCYIKNIFIKCWLFWKKRCVRYSLLLYGVMKIKFTELFF